MSNLRGHLILTTASFCFLLFVSCSNKPEPIVKDILLPNTFYAYHSNKIVFALENKGASIDYSGVIDITFVGDYWITVNISNESDYWEVQGVYTPGTTIWHKPDPGQVNTYPIKAKHLLVSAEYKGWKAGEERKLVLNVIPSGKANRLQLYIGGGFIESITKQHRFPASSGTLNQQGYLSKIYNINIR